MDQEREDYADYPERVAATPPNDRWPRVVGFVILVGLVVLIAIFSLQFVIPAILANRF